MPQRLRRMAGALRVGDQFADLLGGRRARDREGDRHLLEVGRSVIHIVLFRVAEYAAHVSRRVVNGHLVQWREPRQLGEESEGDAHHEVLQGRGPEVGAAA
jgi:hypothetical protein